MEQFSFLRHFLYWMFCWMLRRKKPCGAGGGVTQDPPQHGRGSVPPQPQPQYLAALAGVDTVVEAGGNIPADLAEQHHPVQLCRGTGVSGAPGYPP